MIHVCSITGEAERALNLMDEMKLLDMFPTEITFNALISCFIKRHDMYKEAFRVLEDMKTLGYMPDAKTYCHLLRICAKGGDIKTAALVFDELMQFPNQADRVFPYSVMIESFASNHRMVACKGKGIEENIASAEKIFQRMLAHGIKPNVLVLNSMMKVYTEALRLNRANIMREKFAEYGLKPNIVTYKSMVKMYCRAQRLERAFDLFNIMKLENSKPDLQTYAYLIQGCTKTYFVSSGMRLLREMKEKQISLKPYYHFVLNFRRRLTKNPHLVREIDEMTGKVLYYRPHFLKPGVRKVRAKMRQISTTEQKMLDMEPKFLTPTQLER